MGSDITLHSSNVEQRMSQLGHSRPMTHDRAMSALPPIANIDEGGWHVRFVPKADMLESKLPGVT
jgi:hypothetical protein